MIKMLLAGLGTVGPYSEKLSMTAGLKMLPSAAQFFHYRDPPAGK